jgi:hypothetical protein
MKILVVVFSASLFVACSKDTSPVSVNDGPRGTYVGHIVQYGVNGISSSDQGGARVSLEGTPYSASTDHFGTYILKDVPAGTYTLHFTKPLYDTAVLTHYALAPSGDGTLPDETIQAVPYDSIAYHSIDFRSDTELVLDSATNSSHLDSVLWPLIHVAIIGGDSLPSVSVRFSRQNSSGEWELLGSDLFNVYAGSVSDLLVYVYKTPFLRDPRKKLHRGDKLSLVLRAASNPAPSLPISYSPYATQVKLVVP